MKKFYYFVALLLISMQVTAQIEDVSVYADCSKNGYIKIASGAADVNSSAGRDYCEYVQLWEDGPCWATFNVGATITDYGQLTTGADPTPFIMYADLASHYNTANVGGLYPWSNPNLNGRKTTWEYSVSTGISDIASTLWGGNWKTPSKEQCDSLIDSTYTCWTWCDGDTTQYVTGCTLKGYKVSGVGDYANYSIFLPTAGFFDVNGNIGVFFNGLIGYFWTSDDDSDHPYYAYCLDIGNRRVRRTDIYYGLSVRAILNGIGTSTANITLTLHSNNCNATNVIRCSSGQQLRISADETTGYHFAQWSDGNTYNPRLITMNSDTTFTAEFAKNSYTLTTSINDPLRGTTFGDTTAYYMDTIRIEAKAIYGYHFSCWSDGNTQNPRMVTLTADTTFMATFDKNVYQINKNINPAHGTISGNDKSEYLDHVSLTVTPNYGYHFVQWSDGNTDNPRLLVISKDTTLTAELKENSYTIVTAANYAERGKTTGDTTVLYLQKVKIAAQANYGYHFTQWNDNSTLNPRTIQVKQNATYTAQFDKNQYTLTKVINSNQGSIDGSDKAYYLDLVTWSVVPSHGYHFVNWGDGVKTNPRSFKVTQDTAFTAVLAKDSFLITTSPNYPDRGTTSGDAATLYLENVVISATPYYGYVFTQWNDGNKQNPRVVTVTDNTNYTAIFDKKQFKITKVIDSEQGSILGNNTAGYLDEVVLTVNPYTGYQFTQWSDGVKDNPRTFILTCDTVFSAQLMAKEYTISTAANYTERGSTSGSITALYNQSVQIEAFANYGYHFTMWNDGNTQNPRTITIKGDAQYTAQFDKNTYSITKLYDASKGIVNGVNYAQYLDKVVLTATPQLGYSFVCWSNGVTDNPYTFTITQDTTLKANFELSYSGKCGNNLFWSFVNGTLMISGSGPMYTYTVNSMPWILLRNQISSVIISNGCTSIGAYAFYQLDNVNSITLPSTVEQIGTYAFANCSKLRSFILGSGTLTIEANAFYGDNKLYDVTCYAQDPPTIATNSFSNYSVYLHTLCEAQRIYKIAAGWSQFAYFVCIGAEEEQTTNVKVVTTDNTATITWPTNDGADSYTIEIDKDGMVFCTLTFNAQGQLTNIAFAPGRGGSNSVNATAVVGGYKFTITSLNPSTKYNYEIDIQNASGNSLANYTGSFTTTGTTALEPISFPSREDLEEATKVIKDGQFYILRDGKTYNAQGGEL